jgi:phosphatidylserine/phosphatidylglycerophosphate/cardiolipin synthase-like enzyme
MGMLSQNLLETIHQCAQLLPSEDLEIIINILRENKNNEIQTIITQITAQLPNLNFRRSLNNLLEIWLKESEFFDLKFLAIALKSASYSIEKQSKNLTIDPVWTSPEGCGLPIRQTAQVLLQLINNTQKELTLISFAVYKIPEIVEALIKALDRGVSLRLIVEIPESNKISFGINTALGNKIINRADIFIWQKNHRPQNAQGKYGSLHIKGLISDLEYLFITSANLTEYALTLNLEMGLLIKNQSLAKQINDQFNQLILNSILVPYKS